MMIPGSLEPRRQGAPVTIANPEGPILADVPRTSGTAQVQGVPLDERVREKSGLMVRAIDQFIALLRTVPVR
jgi:hypothetical protein